MSEYRRAFFQEHWDRDNGAGLMAVHDACIASTEDDGTAAALLTSFRHVEDFVGELTERAEALLGLTPDASADGIEALSQLGSGAGGLIVSLLGKKVEGEGSEDRVRYTGEDVVGSLRRTLSAGLWVWRELQKERDALPLEHRSQWEHYALKAFLSRSVNLTEVELNDATEGGEVSA